MRRPTIKQLNDVRLVTGNGWGDGDFVEWMDAPERRRYARSLEAFEQWLEHLQGAKFANKLVGGKAKLAKVEGGKQ